MSATGNAIAVGGDSTSDGAAATAPDTTSGAGGASSDRVAGAGGNASRDTAVGGASSQARSALPAIALVGAVAPTVVTRATALASTGVNTVPLLLLALLCLALGLALQGARRVVRSVA